MVHFGERLRREAWPAWSAHYISYDLLKRKVKEIIEAKEEGKEELLKARKQIFQGTLDSELSKALEFFRESSERIKLATGKTLESLPRDEDASQEDRRNALDAAFSSLHTHADEVKRLLLFVSLNMAAVRKILKKFRKHVEPLPPLPGFLTLEIEHPDDPNFKLSEGTFLPESRAADLEKMHDHKDLKICGERLRRAFDSLKAQRQQLQGSSEGQNSLPQIEIALDDMQAAQDESRRNAKLVHLLTWSETQAGIFTKPPEDEGAVATTLGLFIVCAASTLYMANYQLVLPTVTTFCRHLNVPTSYAGYIIGATDVAAIPTTIVYSKWSNRSFKAPFLFGAVACALSNLLYCASYDHGGIALLGISRFITGLGSSRSLSRRYIAEYTPKSKRTQASTAFVCSSAIGMALGPLLSFPLQQLPDVLWHGIRINPITAAGLVMAVAWLLYGFACYLFFEDPLAGNREQSRDADGVRQPLLRHSNDDVEASGNPSSKPSKPEGSRESRAPDSESQSRWRASLAPTAIAISILWMLKMVQQGYMDGLSLFSATFFDWNSGNVGLLLTLLGASAVPVSGIVGLLSRKLPDRFIVLASVAAAALGCLGLSFYPTAVWGYFGGGALVFLGTLTLEGAAMSLLSKVMHPRLQSGILNAGLLSTEAGTIGRLSGNAAISAVGHITGTDTPRELVRFARALYLFFTAVLLGVQGGMFAIWDRFVV